ncbi:hypothetical protein QEN19_003073 [Hanseniaspora menglaensis]
MVLPVQVSEVDLIDENTDYYKLSKDQYGCRYLQKQLENDSDDNIFLDKIFQKLLTNYQELSVDPFGNYLLQKIVEYLDEPSLELLILELKPNLYTISKNQYGTRSLQKIIDAIYQYESLCDILVNDGFMNIELVDIVDLINDINGNHVIQKCIFKFKNFHYGFIIKAMVHNNNIIKISKNKHGCCVLQKLLSNCNINQMYDLMLKILEFDFELINDQFGNYIVQFLLDVDTEITIEKNNRKSKTPLNLNYILKFMDLENLDLIKLSCLKFSSNVIEKLLIKFFEKLNLFMRVSKDVCSNDDENLNLLQTHMLSVIILFNININTLIKDNYGNYTLQTLLDTNNYQNLIERYWNLIEKYKPLENMKDQDKFILNINPNGWADDDIGTNYDEELKLQKTLKFFSTLVEVDDSLNEHDAFIIKFIVEINNLINSAHGLLGQIKNTSYSKKIKLKLKRYYQEIYHSNNIPKSLTSFSNHKHQSQDEFFHSSNNGNNNKLHSNFLSKNNRSRGHSTSQNFQTNNKPAPVPKQRSSNNSNASFTDDSTSKHMRNISTGAVILDPLSSSATTPLDQTDFHVNSGSETYFDKKKQLNSGSIGSYNYGFGYDNYQKQAIEQQQMMHQRHFSLPSNATNSVAPGTQPENIWAMKNNYSMASSGYNNYNFASATNTNTRNHARTNSLVDQPTYGRSNFTIPESQQIPAVSNHLNGYTSGHISPDSYRPMHNQGSYTPMNFNSVDYTDAYPPAQGYSLNVGNNTVAGHKKESLSNASNNTTMSGNFSNVTNNTAYTNMTPIGGGHKSHASVGSISIGSDGSMVGNISSVSGAPLSNGPWSYSPAVPSTNHPQHIRHSSQGSIWTDTYVGNLGVGNISSNTIPILGHSRTGSYPQGFGMSQAQMHSQNGYNNISQKQHQPQLQEPEFVSLSQQYGFN